MTKIPYSTILCVALGAGALAHLLSMKWQLVVTNAGVTSITEPMNYADCQGRIHNLRQGPTGSWIRAECRRAG